jgi:hypothetical protein
MTLSVLLKLNSTALVEPTWLRVQASAIHIDKETGLATIEDLTVRPDTDIMTKLGKFIVGAPLPLTWFDLDDLDVRFLLAIEQQRYLACDDGY